VGIHEQHLAFYYNKYLKKQFNVKYYGKDSNKELLELMKDTVAINESTSVIEAQLSEDIETFDIFIKMTEHSRREREKLLAAGDESARLKFSQPQEQPRQRHGWDHGGKGGGYQGGKGGGYQGGKGGGYQSGKGGGYQGGKGGGYQGGGYQGGKKGDSKGGYPSNKGYQPYNKGGYQR